MKRLSLTIATLALGATAMAAEGGSSSLIFQQPNENGHLVNLGYGPYSSVKGDVTTTATGAKAASVEAKPGLFNLTYLYGLNNGMALGAEVGFGSSTTSSTATGSTTSTDAKTTGMSDINLWLVANSDMSNMVLRYGGNLAVSPGNNMAANSTTGKDGNNYSGGMNLRPYVAAEWGGKGNVAYGIAGSYQYSMDRKSDNQAATPVVTTIKGGNTLELKPYVEVPFPKGIAAFYLAYDMVGGQTRSANSTDTSLDAYTQMKVGADAKYEFTQSVAGRAGLSYTSIKDMPDATATMKTTLSGLSLDIGAVFSY